MESAIAGRRDLFCQHKLISLLDMIEFFLSDLVVARDQLKGMAEMQGAIQRQEWDDSSCLLPVFPLLLRNPHRQGLIVVEQLRRARRMCADGASRAERRLPALSP